MSADAVAAETRHALVITGASLAVAGALALEYSRLSPSRCSYCVPPRLDAAVRRELVWDHPQEARQLSDVVMNAVVPLFVVSDALRVSDSLPQLGRDLLLVGEAASLSAVAGVVAKTVVPRRRPKQGTGGTSSFWSGHVAFAFSIAVSQATQDSLRDDPAAPWVWGIGLGLASSVGYLLVAGDAHWTTDVLAGAAAGSVAGVATPFLHPHLVGPVHVVPAPGGFAILF